MLRHAVHTTAVALIGLGACVPRALPEEAFDRGSIAIGCCARSDAPIELTYLGVSGWILRKGGSALLTAPFYSNPSVLDAGLTPIRSDPDRIEAHLPDVSDVEAILVGHGHYDHLMDVPYIMRERAPVAVVYGNRTTAYQLAPFGLDEERVRVIGDGVGTVEEPGEWIPVASDMRIMPLRSNHAPHFDDILLYSGVRTRPMREEPRSAQEWLAGEPLAFLIDVLNGDGSVALRLYFQDAVAAAPYGLAPPLDDGVGIDVALITPAAYAEVVWHPEALLENLEPQLVLLGHWENFFHPPSREADPVPFTLLPDFVRRLERALPEGVPYRIPVPRTRFTFR